MEQNYYYYYLWNKIIIIIIYGTIIIIIIIYETKFTQVGLSKEFQSYLLPKVRAAFPHFPDKSPGDLYAAVNAIKVPSYIRVESDEVRPVHS